MKIDLSKIDVVEFLNELGMMKVKKNGNEVTFSCPFGLHMRGGAISMQSGTTLCHCFGCGFSGNAITFLEELEGLTTKEAIDWILERWDASSKIRTDNFKNVIHKKLERSEKKRNATIIQEIKTIPILPISELEDREIDWRLVDLKFKEDGIYTYPFNYLIDRGFTVETLIEWNIGWDEISQTFTIPYHDEIGNLIGFKGRALPGVIPKYKVLGGSKYNFETLDVSRVLFGLHKALPNIIYNDTLIVCEGELNCISMHQDGLNNTVGISGRNLSDQQIEIIKNICGKVVFIFDDWEDQVRAAEQLRRFIPVSVVPEHDKDPADMGVNEKLELLLNRVGGILVK